MTRSAMRELLERVPGAGRLEWIGLAAEKRGEVRRVDEAGLEVGTGLTGDHHGRRGGGKRQVSLIQAEHLPVIAALCGRDDVPPGLVRRNLVVSGLNLYALRDRRFRVGEALLEGTGVCAPCSRMEAALGEGGFQAMRGHGGITARVLEGGAIEVGDAVVAEVESE